MRDLRDNQAGRLRATGAAVPDAKIDVKNTGTGAAQSATSNAQELPLFRLRFRDCSAFPSAICCATLIVSWKPLLFLW